MSRRIDIELTSALGDGTWTWRAAGAKQPKGVLDGAILPSGSKVGDELKVEVEQVVDGLTVLMVVHGRAKAERSDRLELIPAEREFQPVVETRARREPGERSHRDGPRRPRREGDDRARRDDRPRREGDDRARRDDRPRREGDDRARRDDRPRREGDDRARRPRRGPVAPPPPEIPQRPKPKRLKPNKAHRSAVLAKLPEEQRPIAELALQGMAAVRTRLKEDNAKAAAEGRPEMPEATVLKMAEGLLPLLRVAEWRDRAEAAKAQLEQLDLRDLRSVVAASGDPMVARDESTRQLADELRTALAAKQAQELQLWFGDIDANLAVGRVIRALRLSSQPPKAGVPFPADIAQRLLDSVNAALAPMDGPDRWSALLEAAAFSPIRTMVRPVRRPDVVTDELTKMVTRLAPALPLVAELFGIEVAPDAAMPKPPRPVPRARKARPDDRPAARPGEARGRQRGAAAAPATEPTDGGSSVSTVVAEQTTVDVAVEVEAIPDETPEIPVTETPAPEVSGAEADGDADAAAGPDAEPTSGVDHEAGTDTPAEQEEPRP